MVTRDLRSGRIYLHFDDLNIFNIIKEVKNEQ